ncbi:MAG: division/cell wall cluster transcriptional repressor MraZ [Actinomycetes bacterium]
MLLGEHDHSLDDKNRLTLPARHREAMGGHVVIARGLDGCLTVYARAEWDQLTERVGRLDSFSREARQLQRYFFSGAEPASVDKAGRMLIPARLLDEVKIGREVTVAGIHDHLEIWDRAAWRAQVQAVEGSAEDVAERLASRG